MIEPEGGASAQQPGQPAYQTPPPPPPPPTAVPPPPPTAPPQPTYVTTAPPAAAAPATPGISISLSQPEAMVAGGAALILLTDLIFGIFGTSYGVNAVIWAAAAVALVLVLAESRLPFVGGRRDLIIALAALVAVLVGIRSLFADLVVFMRVTGRIDVAYILGMLGLYAGIALLAYGAWTLWKRRPV